VTAQVPSWVRDAVFYQIFPDRFASSARVVKPGPLEDWNAPPTVHGFKGGDLLGVVEHLDHLEALGITAIYLNPVFASASNHRYHTYDYMRVDPLLGGDDALRELLDAAHLRGMRVILDGVFNHASRGFWPFHHVMETGGGSPYREWFHLNQAMLTEGRQLRAYPDEALGQALSADWGDLHHQGEQSLEILGYKAWWDLPALPKLNTDNPVVRQYLMGVAEHWTRFGIDGWRLDVPAEITTPGFWEEFRQRVRAINPEAYIVGEIWQERGDLLDGRTYDGLMNYPLAAAITSHVTGRHLQADVVAQVAELQREIRPENAKTFLARVTRVFRGYRPEAASAMLTLLDTHDTPRFITMAGGDAASLRLGWLVLMTMPGAPCIFYGDEIGLAGAQDPACRAAFPWDRAAWDESLLDYLRALVALRHGEVTLRRGDLQPLAASGTASAYLRSGEEDALLVAMNSGEEPALLELVVDGAKLEALKLPRSEAARVSPYGEGVRLELPARSGSVWRVRR
jgi:cyclomaltodextrinase